MTYMVTGFVKPLWPEIYFWICWAKLSQVELSWAKLSWVEPSWAEWSKVEPKDNFSTIFTWYANALIDTSVTGKDLKASTKSNWINDLYGDRLCKTSLVRDLLLNMVNSQWRKYIVLFQIRLYYYYFFQYVVMRLQRVWESFPSSCCYVLADMPEI